MIFKPKYVGSAIVCMALLSPVQAPQASAKPPKTKAKSAQGKPIPPKPVHRTATLESVPAKSVSDAIKEWNPIPEMAGGQLVFSAEGIGEFKSPIDFLALRKTTPATRTEDVQNYHLRGVASTADLQASPNGHYVIVKAGAFVDEAASAKLYVWDTHSPSPIVPQGPMNSAYSPDGWWSPDSRYFAFYTGIVQKGPGAGFEVSFIPEVYDVQTERSRRLTIIGPVRALAWTADNKLLRVGPYLPQKPKSADDVRAMELGRTSIYEDSLSGAAPRLILKNAGAPLAPSPNGQWIAFQGWDKPPQKSKVATMTASDRMGLYLFDRKNGQRHRIEHFSVYGSNNLDFRSFEQLSWSPDGQTLLAVRSAELYTIEVSTRKIRNLAQFSEKQGTEADRNPFANYSILGYTGDGKFAIFKGAPYLSSISVLAVNLESGEVKTVAHIQRASGVDWVANPASPAPSVSRQGRTFIR